VEVVRIMTTEELRQFIRASRWTFARTMPQTPHEYTLRRDAPDEELFERVVLYIREAGYKAQFAKTTYSYFDVDGWAYWTMGSPLGDTILINRAKVQRVPSGIR
jgi:hypothetical protein